MARPQLRTARKNYGETIKKGDQYWYVQIKTGPRSSRVLRQKKPFKRSQLTQSEYLSTLYDWEDAKAEINDMGEAQDFADQIRTLGEEQSDKLSNMPEGLQQSSSGETLTERAEACEAAANEIEEIISEWESERDNFEPDDESDEFDPEEFVDRVRDVSVG